MKIEDWGYILEKKKLNENPSSRGRVVPSARTGRQTDMMKLIVAFRNFANAPKYRYKYITALKGHFRHPLPDTLVAVVVTSLLPAHCGV
jgi:hypothetical protein